VETGKAWSPYVYSRVLRTARSGDEAKRRRHRSKPYCKLIFLWFSKYFCHSRHAMSSRQSICELWCSLANFSQWLIRCKNRLLKTTVNSCVVLCSTSLPAQHVLPSGFFSCRPQSETLKIQDPTITAGCFRRLLKTYLFT